MTIVVLGFRTHLLYLYIYIYIYQFDQFSFLLCVKSYLFLQLLFTTPKYPILPLYQTILGFLFLIERLINIFMIEVYKNIILIPVTPTLLQAFSMQIGNLFIFSSLDDELNGVSCFFIGISSASMVSISVLSSKISKAA